MKATLFTAFVKLGTGSASAQISRSEASGKTYFDVCNVRIEVPGNSTLSTARTSLATALRALADNVERDDADESTTVEATP